MSTSRSLLLPRQLHDAMVEQARSEYPFECCGLLAGRCEAGVASAASRLPMRNASRSPIAYSVEPKDLFQAFRRLREMGEELLAIYHSHPNSPAIPSRVDHAEWNYGPDIACVIVSLAGEAARVRAWSLEAGRHVELDWHIDG